MDNRKVDHTVAKAILSYIISDPLTNGGLAWGNLDPDRIRLRMMATADPQNYVAVSPLFQWLQQNETHKLIGFANKNLNKFRYLIGRASVR